jgi:hypothetical protein
VQFLKLGHQRLVIQAIRLIPADVDEADALLTVDEKYSRPSDVERREPKPMVDPVALDDRTIWIDQNRKGETTAAVIRSHLRSALADNHHDLGPEGLIDRQIRLQLLQLLAAVRSPGTTNKHQYYSPGAEYVCEPNFLAVAGLQREGRCHVAPLEAGHCLVHHSS